VKRAPKGLLSGFPPALKGLREVLRSERHARFHLIATLLAIGGGLAANLTDSEWLWVALAIALVWITELINTAIERLANRITTEPDPLIAQAKDLAAAAVLVAATFALIVGIKVFL
jgi:diacylglycerol kinase